MKQVPITEILKLNFTKTFAFIVRCGVYYRIHSIQPIDDAGREFLVYTADAYWGSVNTRVLHLENVVIEDHYDQQQ